jgi:hypothetical protein
MHAAVAERRAEFHRERTESLRDPADGEGQTGGDTGSETSTDHTTDPV